MEYQKCKTFKSRCWWSIDLAYKPFI